MNDFLKAGKAIWVKINNDSNEGVFGIVVSITDDKVVYTSYNELDTNKTAKITDVFGVVRAPIDEKNIISDWIEEDFLDNCVQQGNEYMGWFLRNYPVYCKVLSNGVLKVVAIGFSDTECIYQDIKNFITDFFTQAEDNCRIEPLYTKAPDGLFVELYFIIDN